MSFIGIKRKFTDNRNISESKKMKTDSIPEHNFINYTSVPSLESIAIINVTIGLCKQPDIRDAIRQHSIKFDPVGGGFSGIRGTYHDNSLHQLERSILNKLSLIPLPNLLKAKVANVVTPVLLQILEWIRTDRKDIEYMNSVHWTNVGTIDKVKTLKQLVYKDSNLYIDNHYKLACQYCSENDIHNLWHKLHKETQENYLHKKEIYKNYYNHLIAYWTSIVKKELPGLLSKIKPYDSKNLYNCSNSIYQNMFQLAIFQDNILAVKYFWNKLTAEEVNRNLAQWINISLLRRNIYCIRYQSTGTCSDILYFLLSQMDDADQQREVFQKNSAVILNSLFFDWPWQRFLLPTIRTIWSSLDEQFFMQLLSRAGKEIKSGKTTEKLLRKLFQESPVNLKKCFIQCIINNHYCSTDIICNLLAVEDLKTVKLILNYANVQEKKQIIFSTVRNDKLCNVIYTEKLSLFDVLIGETLSSETDIYNIKAKIIQEYGNRLCRDWISDDNFQMVENFFSWAFTSQDQIDNFKNEILDKVEITFKIIKHLGNYELADKFISWCFSNKEEINQFKKQFPVSKYEIITIGEKDWSAFEKFIRWCFISDEDIDKFKFNVLHSPKTSEIIHDSILLKYDFEFVDNLIHWCCHSDEEIKEFKKDFIFSNAFINILQRFVSDYKVYDAECDNWELSRKLIKLFFPHEKEIIIELKEIITEHIEFNENFGSSIEKKHLFHLIDNHNYNIDDDDENC